MSPSGPSWDVDVAGRAVDLGAGAAAPNGGADYLGSPGPEGQEQRNHLRLIRQQESRRANRRRLLVSLGIACVAALCLGLVALHVLIAENQFRLDQLQQTASSEQESYERLRLQVAELEAPARIVSEAEGRFGMVQPGSVTYLPAVSATSQATASAGNGTSAGAGDDQPSTDVSQSQGGIPAPEGDADWPSIKPYLSGSP